MTSAARQKMTEGVLRLMGSAASPVNAIAPQGHPAQCRAHWLIETLPAPASADADIDWQMANSAEAWLSWQQPTLERLTWSVGLYWSRAVAAQRCDGRVWRLIESLTPDDADPADTTAQNFGPVPTSWDDADLKRVGAAVLMTALSRPFERAVLARRIADLAKPAWPTARAVVISRFARQRFMHDNEIINQ